MYHHVATAEAPPSTKSNANNINATKLCIEADTMWEACNQGSKNVTRQDVYDFIVNSMELSSDAGLVWRRARAAYDLYKAIPTVTEGQKEQRKKMIFEALQYSQSAVQLDPNNGDAQRWYARHIYRTTHCI